MISTSQAAFAIASSRYSELKYAVVATAGEAFAIRSNGTPYIDQTRPIARLARSARRAPATPEERLSLAALNLSAIAFGPSHPAASADEATTRAVAVMQAQGPSKP